MKKVLTTLVMSLLGFMPMNVSTPMVAAGAIAPVMIMMPQQVEAEDIKCHNKELATCDARAPSGHKYKGGKKKKLEYRVLVCHPDFHLLARKWFSFAFFPQGKKDKAVARLRSGRQWHEVLEAPEGQQCVEHYYEPGRVLMIVTPCRVPGKNVILVTRPLTAADSGTVAQFYEIAGSAF